MTLLCQCIANPTSGKPNAYLKRLQLLGLFCPFATLSLKLVRRHRVQKFNLLSLKGLVFPLLHNAPLVLKLLLLTTQGAARQRALQADSQCLRTPFSPCSRAALRTAACQQRACRPRPCRRASPSALPALLPSRTAAPPRSRLQGRGVRRLWETGKALVGVLLPAAAQSKPAALLASVGNTCTHKSASRHVSALQRQHEAQTATAGGPACRRCVAAKDSLAVVKPLRLL